MRYDEIIAENIIPEMPKKFSLVRLIHFSRAIKMSHKKPIQTLSIFLGVNFSQSIKKARIRTINTFAR